MFFSGAGGSGKSECIRQVILYGRKFCEELKVPFTKQTIRVTALTGVAAVAINGETIDSAACLQTRRENLTHNDVTDWKSCRLLIIDEISFMSVAKLIQTNDRLNQLREQFTMFGGVSIVFCGDFRQLEPVGKGSNEETQPIYAAEGKGKALFRDAVNAFVELKGLHRFKDDKEWGEILLCLRNGEPTADDFEKINSRHIPTLHDNGILLPENSRYATYFNRTRDWINSQLFKKRIHEPTQEAAEDDLIMIFCDKIHLKQKNVYQPLSCPEQIWFKVGESDCTSARQGRIDPVLKLWKYREVMLTENELNNGNANGSQLIVIQVVLKHGCELGSVVVEGKDVPATVASDIKHVVVLDKQQNRIKHIEPKKFFFKASYPLPSEFCARSRSHSQEILSLSAFQIPFITNDATTGFKLQGSSVDNIVVTELSDKANWTYVLLSRVRTINGLFLKNKIPTDPALYAFDPKLKALMEEFCTKFPRVCIDNGERPTIAPLPHQLQSDLQ